MAFLDEDYIKRFKVNVAYHILNPRFNFKLRPVCRYCGTGPLEMETTVFRMNGNGIAHVACYNREHDQ